VDDSMNTPETVGRRRAHFQCLHTLSVPTQSCGQDRGQRT
jgi:hypothetical protein